jgi:glyoxylase-like metal-dependent hydrolase (beta-lactamase superfamily II)
MQGTVTTTRREQVAIHTYTSPESGLAVNTHVIELASQLLILDTQYGLPFASEAAEFAASLGKPITRVYVSHAHPDHFFGAGVFNTPVYALPSTRETIAAAGDVMLAGNKAAVGDFVPDKVTVPTIDVEPGVEVIDGVRFEFAAVTQTEAEAMLIIELANEGVVLAQDLVYDNLHLYLAEKHLAGWRTSVEELRSKGFSTVLPGHGAPGGPELYDYVLAYLDVAEPALANATNGAELKNTLLTAFPRAGGAGLLDIQNGYLFPTA